MRYIIAACLALQLVGVAGVALSEDHTTDGSQLLQMNSQAVKWRIPEFETEMKEATRKAAERNAKEEAETKARTFYSVDGGNCNSVDDAIFNMGLCQFAANQLGLPTATRPNGATGTWGWTPPGCWTQLSSAPPSYLGLTTNESAINSGQYQAICRNATLAPTAAPTAAPTQAVTPAAPITAAANANAAGVSATGDPHLTNVYGQRFDLLRAGMHKMLQIPRYENGQALLRVDAKAEQIGASCMDMYFTSINITGQWVSGATGMPALEVHAGRPDTNSLEKWMSFGAIDLKVVSGHTSGRIEYLNLYVRHLHASGLDVGGLLGMDDHTEASAPNKNCHRVTNLLSISSTAATSTSGEAHEVSEALVMD